MVLPKPWKAWASARETELMSGHSVGACQPRKEYSAGREDGCTTAHLLVG